MKFKAGWVLLILAAATALDPARAWAQSEEPDPGRTTGRSAVGSSPDDTDELPPPRAVEGKPVWTADAIGEKSSLADLVRHALTTNPRLAERRAEADAMWARVPQVTALPDPMFSANAFVLPIETAAGGQWANLSFSQRIPSLKRLDAQGRQTAAEASALEQMLAAEAVRVIADVKVVYYRLYFLAERVRINRANQVLLTSLGKVANARILAGGAGAGDVLRANLELSKLDEELLDLDRQIVAANAELNRLLYRPAVAPLPTPTGTALGIWEPRWPLETLVAKTLLHQPEVLATRLRYEAALVGVEVARLLDVPDLTFGTTWVMIDGDRPPSRVVDVGRDALSVGLTMNLPIYRAKYTAARSEAVARTFAAASRVEDVTRRYEATLADLLAQARAARRTMTLYEKTVLPLAGQTYRTDLDAYAQPNGGVDFDRLMADYLNLLNAEIQYHRSITNLAVAEARIEQAVAVKLDQVPLPPKSTTADNGGGGAPEVREGRDDAPKK